MDERAELNGRAMADLRENDVRDDMEAASGVPLRTLWALGLGGLVPFLVMTALIAYAGRDFIAYPQLVLGLGGYGAVILSFLGGIRWGASLMSPRRGRGTLALSVLPSIFGWICLFVPSPWNFAGLALGFLAQGVWDVLAIRRGQLPQGFRPLRVALTVVVVLCMAIACASTFPVPG